MPTLDFSKTSPLLNKDYTMTFYPVATSDLRSKQTATGCEVDQRTWWFPPSHSNQTAKWTEFCWFIAQFAETIPGQRRRPHGDQAISKYFLECPAPLKTWAWETMWVSRFYSLPLHKGGNPKAGEEVKPPDHEYVTGLNRKEMFPESEFLLELHHSPRHPQMQRAELERKQESLNHSDLSYCSAAPRACLIHFHINAPPPHPTPMCGKVFGLEDSTPEPSVWCWKRK